MSQPFDRFLDQVRTLADPRPLDGLDDGQLLDRFSRGRDEAAFAALVRRHGPLVRGVCGRLLADPHAAEDAFQATFLVLARKAPALHRHRSAACWLYTVAARLARRLRARAARTRTVERRAAPRAAADPLAEITGRELVAVLDEELHRLPEKY